MYGSVSLGVFFSNENISMSTLLTETAFVKGESCSGFPMGTIATKSIDRCLGRYTGSMGLRLYVATTSQGKLRDFRTASETHSVAIESLPDLTTIPAPDETGATFAANATLKAVYYSRFAAGELVVADDSGLEVEALSGAP